MNHKELRLHRHDNGKYAIFVDNVESNQLKDFDCPRKAVHTAMKTHPKVVVVIPQHLSEDFTNAKTRIVFDPADVSIKIESEIQRP